uniref:Vitamin K epoxide reductase domain-containing protein n=1 Tax=Geoglobus ahangari TaxID=113653 RepID=A0A7J3TG25_9EURY
MLWIICLAGLILCGYLLYLTEYVGLCLGHCDPLNYWFGMAWFFVGLILKNRFLKIWALLGVLGVGYFVTREILEGFCFYCTVIHLIALCCVALTLWNLQKVHQQVGRNKIKG